MMMGLVGLVGLDTLRCGGWEFMCSVTQHAEMIKTLSYLIVDKMDNV